MPDPQFKLPPAPSDYDAAVAAVADFTRAIESRARFIVPPAAVPKPENWHRITAEARGNWREAQANAAIFVDKLGVLLVALQALDDLGYKLWADAAIASDEFADVKTAFIVIIWRSHTRNFLKAALALEPVLNTNFSLAFLSGEGPEGFARLAGLGQSIRYLRQFMQEKHPELLKLLLPSNLVTAVEVPK